MYLIGHYNIYLSSVNIVHKLAEDFRMCMRHSDRCRISRCSMTFWYGEIFTSENSNNHPMKSQVRFYYSKKFLLRKSVLILIKINKCS